LSRNVRKYSKILDADSTFAKTPFFALNGGASQGRRDKCASLQAAFLIDF